VFPVVVDLGTWDLPLLGPTPVFLPTYGLLFAASVVLAWYWFTRRARTLGIADEPLFNLAFWTVLAGILGAKLLLVLVDWRDYVARPALLLGTLRSAGVLYGGVIAGGLAFVGYCRRHDLPTWKLADALAAPLALAQAVGRLGCFAAGCCWGVPTHAGHPCAVVFRDSRAAAQTGVPLDAPLIAIQPLQAAADAALALVLAWMWRRRPSPDGTVAWTFVLLYGISRGVLELWRGDAVRGVYLGGRASTSQLVAAAAVALAVVALARGRLRADPVR
jgi:phosphatidylglycerol:prolipoprotein diacylglycerol transferase